MVTWCPTLTIWCWYLRQCGYLALLRSSDTDKDSTSDPKYWWNLRQCDIQYATPLWIDRLEKGLDCASLLVLNNGAPISFIMGAYDEATPSVVITKGFIYGDTWTLPSKMRFAEEIGALIFNVNGWANASRTQSDLLLSIPISEISEISISLCIQTFLPKMNLPTCWNWFICLVKEMPTMEHLGLQLYNCFALWF